MSFWLVCSLLMSVSLVNRSFTLFLMKTVLFSILLFILVTMAPLTIPEGYHFQPQYTDLCNFLISNKYSAQNLFYISMLLHAIFFYMFAFSTVYTFLITEFNSLYVRIFFRFVISYIKYLIIKLISLISR